MTKMTKRDDVWNFVMVAVLRKYEFGVDHVREETTQDVSDRTIRDVLNTATRQGWLEKEKKQSHTWRADVDMRNNWLKETSLDA